MRLTILLMSLALALAPAAPAMAQDRFNAAITVNNDAITPYELDQRARMLGVFNTPGDLAALARAQLVEERLKAQELARAGVSITPENLTAELEAFAARANLSLAEFRQVLARDGVAPETLEQFVRIGVTWRDYVRLRFGPRVTITDTEVARAIAQAGGGDVADGIELLLTEIIIPAPPPRAAQAQAIAERLAAGASQAQFEAAARQYSALPSRANSGRLEWLPLSNFPSALQPLLRGLAVGEVTQPIQIPGAVALFQSRGIREAPRPRPTPASIDYAMFSLPAAAGETAARALDARTDTCDGLYGAAQGQPRDVLVRLDQAPAQIPQDIALELARLDADEASWNLLRNNGQTRVYLMLCQRSYAGAEDLDPEAVRNQLQGQRLEGYANALLADLRAAATIRP